MSKFITYPQSLESEYTNNPEVPQPIGFVEAYQRAKISHKKDFLDTAVVRDDNAKVFGFGGYGYVCTRWYAEDAKVEFLYEYKKHKNGGGGYVSAKPVIKYK